MADPRKNKICEPPKSLPVGRVLQGPGSLGKLANLSVGAVPVVGRSGDVQQTDIMQVLRSEEGLSVQCNDHCEPAIRLHNPEHVVDDAVVVASLAS